MAKVRGAIVVDAERCKGCALCVAACPTHVVAIGKKVNSKGYFYTHLAEAEGCIGCAQCSMVCPDSCITVYRVKLN